MFVDEFVAFATSEYAKKRGDISFSALLALNDAQLRAAIQKNCFYEEVIAELPQIYEKYLEHLKENGNRVNFCTNYLSTISKIKDKG